MPDWNSYVQGLHRIGKGSYAYLQPDGSWGLNNAGLVVSDGVSMLVDTLCDLPRTRRMLAAMAEAEPAAKHIDIAVITHNHVDHSFGVAAVAGSRIIMSTICANTIKNTPPDAWVKRTMSLEGDSKTMFDEFFGTKHFDFTGVQYTPPTQTFEGTLELEVGKVTAHIVEVGPVHTKSDSIVWVPEEEVVFGGDLLNPGSHLSLNLPFVDNWIKACDIMIGWNARVYVPGHRALCSLDDVKEHREYLQFMKDEARKRYDAGIPLREAIEDMLNNLGPYKSYRRPEQLLSIVNMLYAGFEGKKDAAARGHVLMGDDFLSNRLQFRNSLRERRPDLPMQY